MNLDIIKPKFPKPAPPPNDYYKYLASVELSPKILRNSCVKKAKVVGVYSRQSVNIECDGNTYEDVPVWIHTDVGARLALAKGVERAIPADYFQDAAMIFTFPGADESSFTYVTAIIYRDPETEVLTAIGVIGVLQIFHSGIACEIKSQTDVAQYVIKNPLLSSVTLPTYRPYAYFKIVAYLQNDPDYVVSELYSLYNIVEGEFENVPTYVDGVPNLPLTKALHLSVTDEVNNILAFLSKSIFVGSDDCFVNMVSTPTGDENASPPLMDKLFNALNNNLTFKERDSEELISVERVASYTYENTQDLGELVVVWQVGLQGLSYYQTSEANSATGYNVTRSSTYSPGFGNSRINVYSSIINGEWSHTVEEGGAVNIYWFSGTQTKSEERLYLSVTDLAIEFCKSFLYDVYTDGFFAVGAKYVMSEFVTSCGPESFNYYMNWIISSEDFTIKTGSGNDPYYAFENRIYFNDEIHSQGVTNNSISGAFTPLAEGLHDLFTPEEMYTRTIVISELKLYLVPYDLRAGLLT